MCLESHLILHHHHFLRAWAKISVFQMPTFGHICKVGTSAPAIWLAGGKLLGLAWSASSCLWMMCGHPMGTDGDLIPSRNFTACLVQDRACVRSKSGPEFHAESSAQRFRNRSTKAGVVVRLWRRKRTLGVCSFHAPSLWILPEEGEGLTLGTVCGHNWTEHRGTSDWLWINEMIFMELRAGIETSSSHQTDKSEGRMESGLAWLFFPRTQRGGASGQAERNKCAAAQ